MVIQGINYPSDFEAKKEMIEIGRRMAEKNYVIAGDGSLSVRVGPNAVWITAEGADKGVLKQDNFIRVDLNGKQMPGSRQSRLPEDISVHLQIYSRNPSLRSVIHAYPMGTVALTAIGESVQSADYTPSVRKLGRMTLASGTTAEEEAKAAILVCKNDSGILFVGDGCMVWGESLTEAFHRLEALEYYAEVRRMLRSGNGTSQKMKPVPATYVPADDYSPASSVISGPVFGGMEGLTPLIRPDTVNRSFVSAGERMAESAGAVFLSPETSYVASSAETVSAAGVPTRNVLNRNVSTRSSSEEDAVASRREQMMAEVVRRSLASLK